MTATISSLMASADRGDAGAAETLFSTLYAELHRLARRELARGAAVSLGVTTLLHEAYLGMSARDGISFPDRARFMGYASRVMRGLVIDHARHRRTQKRGGEFHLTSYDTENLAHQGGGPSIDAARLSVLSDALDELATIEASLAEIVDLKFFCGFSFADIATMRGVSERTVQRGWERARIYLYHQLRTDLPPDE